MNERVSSSALSDPASKVQDEPVHSILIRAAKTITNLHDLLQMLDSALQLCNAGTPVCLGKLQGSIYVSLHVKMRPLQTGSSTDLMLHSRICCSFQRA